ncbi:MAG: SUMF1/EgtB/PvdO family nonheme iron enzyme [Myxococcales bacterium]|nr:SUMF1/EgtB/PvdO family nonheme iron enzyme [Myxococcales bacterium]
MADHIDDETLTAWVEGELDIAKQTQVRSHIVQCDDCRELVAAMAGSYFADNPPVDGEPAGRSLGPTSAEPPQKAAADCSPTWQYPEQVDEYRLLRPLGNGAMGMVFLAEDKSLDRQVAIKFISEAEPDQASRERFLREARAIARLTHPNVVAIHRIGEVAGRPYLVSEFVRGQSLDKLPRPVSSQLGLSIAIDLTRGLQAAHQRGVLHRDIKPANAIQAEDGTVKLLDFGLAKLIDLHAETGKSSQDVRPVDPRSGHHGTTTQGVLLGTPLYLAPERWLGSAATRQSDLYSLGSLLYELLSGQSPFSAQTLEELRAKCTEEDAPPLTSINPQVPAALGRLIDQCIRRNPNERPKSAEALLRSLLAIQGTGGLRPLSGVAWLAVLGVAVGLSAAGWLGYPRIKRWLRPSMVHVAAGSFTMGSSKPEIESAEIWCRQADPQCEPGLFNREAPLRAVQLSPFWLDTTEVTTADFAAWLNRLQGQKRLVVDTKKEDEIWVREGGLPLVNLYPFFAPPYEIKYLEAGQQFIVAAGMSRKPARQVTWIGASHYCRDHDKRLPTEAEWEYAARGPEGRRFPWGEEPPRCDGLVFALWTYESVGGRLQKRDLGCVQQWTGVLDVGTASQDVTPLGIHDLAGNAAEWVADRFEEAYRPCPAPCRDPIVVEHDESGPTLRVFRGGSYSGEAVVTRASGRGRYAQNQGLTDVGFRCARSADR